MNTNTQAATIVVSHKDIHIGGEIGYNGENQAEVKMK